MNSLFNFVERCKGGSYYKRGNSLFIAERMRYERNKNSSVQDITSYIKILNSHFEIRSAIKIGTRCEAFLYSSKGVTASTEFDNLVNLNGTNQFDFAKPMYVDKWFNGRADTNKTYQVRINTDTGIIQSLAYADETMSSSIFYYATWFEKA